MDNRKTIYLFLVLIFASWIIEFFVGWKLMNWWWGTAWFAFSYPGAKPTAQFIAELGQVTRYNPGTRTYQTVSLHWTPEGVILILFAVYVFLHVVNAVWNGLLRPFFKRWQMGARRPIGDEVKKFEAAYATIAKNVLEPVSRPGKWLVVDGPGLDMRWIGYVLVIDRELLSHRYFTALLAAQLGHTNSEDRLAHRLYDMLPPTACIAGVVFGWPFAVGHVLLFPFWMWYWRARVFASDRFAVERGQGYTLARALEEIYLRVDNSTRGGRLLKPMPYVAERIHRIQRLLEQRTPGAPRII